MKKVIAFAFFIFCSILAVAQDAEGCKDSPLFTRMPNTIISECTSNYDEMEISTGDDQKEKKEGTKTTISYTYEHDENTAPSFFQIVKNFENAVAKTGGKKIYYSKDGGVATLFTRTADKDTWIVLNDFSGGKKGNFQLHILVIEGMKQDIAANELLESINKTGSVSLQINFETGKAAIKPDSEGIVTQIAEMLKSDPALKVSIEGHTDNSGTTANNKTLSENRAKSVVKALIDKGIDKTRLSSKGWGQEKPVAENDTEEGKTKNRRVEIVKM